MFSRDTVGSPDNDDRMTTSVRKCPHTQLNVVGGGDEYTNYEMYNPSVGGQSAIGCQRTSFFSFHVYLHIGQVGSRAFMRP